MKKDDDSSVSIKQILVTALFLTVITFGSLNMYKIGYVEEQDVIHTIETANHDINEYEVALVENTEEDIVYTENVKFLAAKVVEPLDIAEELQVMQAESIEVQESGDNNTAVKTLGVPAEYLKTIDVKATAYCLCKKCCGKSASNPAYGVTASGLKIIPGIGMKVVASDPSVIPLGTEVYIEGLYGASDYGYAIVADTGSAIKNLKIDLYMDTHQMALNWGVKTVRVYVLDK